MSFRRINDQLVIDGTNNITASINIIRQLQADCLRKDAEIDRLRKQLAAVGVDPDGATSTVKHEHHTHNHTHTPNLEHPPISPQPPMTLPPANSDTEPGSVHHMQQ